MAGGKATGIVSTAAIWDATPAVFATHAVVRNHYWTITKQMTKKGMDVLMGGGRRAFQPSERPDSADLIAELRQAYAYVETADQLENLDLDTVKTLAGLFAPCYMGPVAGRSPTLPRMVSAAIAVLSRDPDGFFLMVENEEPDSRAHSNDPAEILTADMLDFDAAIAIALEYQARNPETLVVVTSDHETGGISLPPDENSNINLTYSTSGHTGVVVPIFAKGPGASNFGGMMENREVGRLLMAAVSNRNP